MTARFRHNGAGTGHRAPRVSPRMSAIGFVATMASIPVLINVVEMIR